MNRFDRIALGVFAIIIAGLAALCLYHAIAIRLKPARATAAVSVTQSARMLNRLDGAPLGSFVKYKKDYEEGGIYRIRMNYGLNPGGRDVDLWLQAPGVNKSRGPVDPHEVEAVAYYHAGTGQYADQYADWQLMAGEFALEDICLSPQKTAAK